MAEMRDVSPYVAREMARLYPERWAYDADRYELTARPRSLASRALGWRKEASMPRVTYKDVTFRRPFALAGVDGPQPAGTYTVETEEALLETLSTLAYRRTATLIHVASGPGVMQALPISQDELDQALALDAE